MKGIKRFAHEGRHADHEAHWQGHQHGQEKAQRHPAQRMGQLDADAFVVGAFVIKRIGQVADHGLAHFKGRRKSGAFDRARVFAHHLLVFDLFGRHARLGSAGHRGGGG
jgi:hypothetical protein